MHTVQLTASTATSDPRAQRHDARIETVTVLIGPAPDMTDIDVWPTPDKAPTHHYEACYDAEHLDQQGAEARVRDQLAASGVSVATFISDCSGSACQVYPGLCTETGPHHDHSAHFTNLTGPDYGFVHLSTSTPKLYVGDDEFLPGQAYGRAVAHAELGWGLLEMEKQVRAGEALGRLRRVRRSVAAPLAEILTIMEETILEGHDPVEVGEQVLGIIAEAKAKRAGATA